MFTLPGLAAEALGAYLAEQLSRTFGSTDARLTNLVPHLSRLAFDWIGNSDALYHNVEHTMLVTQVGNEIMAGRAQLMPTSANDYAHVIAACLFHDIGYVRGILKGDGADGYVIDSKGGKTALARGSSDAALNSPRSGASSSRNDLIKPAPVRRYPFYGQVSLADDPYKPVAPYPKIPYGSFHRQRTLSIQNRNDVHAPYD